MAALVVQSRFAGLKIEDDDYPSSSEGKTKKTKNITAKKPEPAKKNKPNANNNKPQEKQQSAPKKKKTKQPACTSQQWEQWKQKDEELVDGNYEDELQQAILLSKLDFEEKKDVYKQTKKDAELEKKLSDQAVKNTSKKQKKKNVMSLDQFNDMMTTGEEAKHNHEEEKQVTDEAKAPDRDTAFFERVKDEAKSELLRDKIIDRVRNRKCDSDQVINRSQFADALERKEKEIATLKEEVTSLKAELLTVKGRNKKLCHILGQGEMKDKAEVLIEVDRLRNVQSELTAELAALHSELERERSRVADPRARDKKKRTASEKEK